MWPLRATVIAPVAAQVPVVGSYSSASLRGNAAGPFPLIGGAAGDEDLAIRQEGRRVTAAMGGDHPPGLGPLPGVSGRRARRSCDAGSRRSRRRDRRRRAPCPSARSVVVPGKSRKSCMLPVTTHDGTGADTRGGRWRGRSWCRDRRGGRCRTAARPGCWAAAARRGRKAVAAAGEHDRCGDKGQGSHGSVHVVLAIPCGRRARFDPGRGGQPRSGGRRKRQEAGSRCRPRRSGREALVGAEGQLASCQHRRGRPVDR